MLQCVVLLIAVVVLLPYKFVLLFWFLSHYLIFDIKCFLGGFSLEGTCVEAQGDLDACKPRRCGSNPGNEVEKF